MGTPTVINVVTQENHNQRQAREEAEAKAARDKANQDAMDAFRAAERAGNEANAPRTDEGATITPFVSHEPDLSIMTDYFLGISRGNITPDETEFKSIINQTWAALSAQGFPTAIRAAAIQDAMDRAGNNPAIVTAIEAVGGTGVGTIDPSGRSLTDADLLRLYGTASPMILGGNYTDYQQGFDLDIGGAFTGLGGSGAGVPPPYTPNFFGGSVAPVYRAPDERVITEQIENYLKNVIGEHEDVRVRGLLRRYMSDDRRNFDSKKQAIDPWATVKEIVRKDSDYKALHHNRPEDQDESTWVATSVANARAQGVRAADQVDRAQAGAKVGDVTSSQKSFQVQSGQQNVPAFFQTAARIGTSLGNSIR